MKEETKSRYLTYALYFIGFIFIFCIYPLMVFWSSGWQWVPPQPEYEQMILGIYATLGIFLIRAAKNPDRHLSLIWFTAWSSLVHGGIMAFQALSDARDFGHLYGDVPALLIIFVVLTYLTPWTVDD